MCRPVLDWALLTPLCSLSRSDVIFASRLALCMMVSPSAVPHPLIGPAEGATLVSVFGSGFLASPYVWCNYEWRQHHANVWRIRSRVA